jgi:membrane-associated phospholipid phosphatase
LGVHFIHDVLAGFGVSVLVLVGTWFGKSGTWPVLASALWASD